MGPALARRDRSVHLRRRDHLYLRHATSSDPLERGWDTHPAGTTDGVDLDVVYDPSRHEVCRTIGRLNADTLVALHHAGFHRAVALDHDTQVWARPRPVSVRALLAGFGVVDGGRTRTR